MNFVLGDWCLIDDRHVLLEGNLLLNSQNYWVWRKILQKSKENTFQSSDEAIAVTLSISSTFYTSIMCITCANQLFSVYANTQRCAKAFESASNKHQSWDFMNENFQCTASADAPWQSCVLFLNRIPGLLGRKWFAIFSPFIHDVFCPFYARIQINWIHSNVQWKFMKNEASNCF